MTRYGYLIPHLFDTDCKQLHHYATISFSLWYCCMRSSNFKTSKLQQRRKSCVPRSSAVCLMSHHVWCVPLVNPPWCMKIPQPDHIHYYDIINCTLSVWYVVGVSIPCRSQGGPQASSLRCVVLTKQATYCLKTRLITVQYVICYVCLSSISLDLISPVMLKCRQY